MTLVESPPSKPLWKRDVNRAVNAYWMDELKAKAKDMSTAMYLDINRCTPGKVADIWCHNCDPIEARMASVKCCVQVQRYPLGYSHCAGKQKATICTLCSKETETVEHFLLVCPALEASRRRYINRMAQYLPDPNLLDPVNADSLVKLIMAPSLYVLEQNIPALEQVSRRLIYSLHCARSRLLGKKLTYYSGRPTATKLLTIN